MCGINGFIGKEDFFTERFLNRLNDSISHRGPDSDGVFLTKENETSIGMGMRRLAIIDVDNGRQPIYSQCGDCIIVFNGEIYNHHAIRQQCINLGYNFRTDTDTEVVLALYILFGEKAFDSLDGMYAFSIYDSRNKLVLIGRDFFGEKPLYYAQINGNFLWSSELKSIVQNYPKKFEISQEGVANFLTYQFIPAPLTIYTDIKKLERNSLLKVYVETLDIGIDKIHRVDIKKQKVDSEESEIIKDIKGLVERSVNSRTTSDIGFASFLSGGVDSGIVTQILAKSFDLDTYTVGVATAGYDESNDATFLANHLGIKNFTLPFDVGIGTELLKEALLVHDEPFADTSLISTFLLFREAAKTEHKVFLSGDGGDEMFIGYNKHNILLIDKLYKNFVSERIHSGVLKVLDRLSVNPDKRSILTKVSKALKSISYDGFTYNRILMQGFKPEDLESLMRIPQKISMRKVEDIDEARELDLDISLEGGLLPKVDRSSMYFSLEVRSPFLNYHIYKYLLTIRTSLLLKYRASKRLLKMAFTEAFPKNYFRKPKRGFGVPVNDVLNSLEIRNELSRLLDDALVEKQGLFNVEYVASLRDEFLDGSTRNLNKIWTLFCFQLWFYNKESR